MKRYVDLFETVFLASGLGPTLIARGPTAAALALTLSALLHLMRRLHATLTV